MSENASDILPTLFESTIFKSTVSLEAILTEKSDKFYTAILEQTNFYPKSLFIVAHSGTTLQILTTQLEKRAATTKLNYEHDKTSFKENNSSNHIIRIELNPTNIQALLQIALPDRKMAVFLNQYKEEMEKYILDHKLEYAETLLNYAQKSNVIISDNPDLLLLSFAQQTADCGLITPYDAVNQVTTYAVFLSTLEQFTSLYMVIKHHDMLAFSTLLKDAKLQQRLPDGKSIVTFHFDRGSDFYRLMQLHIPRDTDAKDSTVNDISLFKQIALHLLVIEQFKQHYIKYCLKLLSDFYRSIFTGIKDEKLNIILTLCERYSRNYGVQQPLIIARTKAQRTHANIQVSKSEFSTGQNRLTQPTEQPAQTVEQDDVRQQSEKQLLNDSLNYLYTDQLSLGQVQERLKKLWGEFKPAIDMTAEDLLENMGFFKRGFHDVNHFSKDQVCRAWEYKITLIEANEELIDLYREKRGKNIDIAHGAVCISLPTLALMYVLKFLDTADIKNPQYALAIETAVNLVKRYSLIIPKAYQELIFSSDNFSDLAKWQATETYQEHHQEQLNLKAAYEAHQQASLRENSLFKPPREKIADIDDPDADHNPPPFSGLVIAKSAKGSSGRGR